jgi:hypothetical protein
MIPEIVRLRLSGRISCSAIDQRLPKTRSGPKPAENI